MTEVVIGIDVGTQGARVLAVSPRGDVLASAERALPPGPAQPPPQRVWLRARALPFVRVEVPLP